MSETTTAPEAVSETEGVDVHPIAIQALAALRVLRELSERQETQGQAEALLGKFFNTMSSYIASTADRENKDAKLVRDLPESLQIAVGTSCAVLGAYFEFKGDWKKMVADLQHLTDEAHKHAPVGYVEEIVQCSAAKLRQDLAAHFAKRQAVKSAIDQLKTALH